MTRRDERGTALVELAFALPILLAIVFGLLDFGRAVYVHNVLANAARDGARFASVDPNNTACVQSVANQRASIATLSSVTVTKSTVAVGQPVTVTVQSSYQPLTPFVAQMIGNAGVLNLSGKATMSIRNVPASALSCP